MIYSKIQNGSIVQTETVGKHRGDPLTKIVDGELYKIASPSANQYELAGWKLYVEPVALATQDRTTELVINGVTYSYVVRDKTPEELQIEADALANQQEIEAEIEASPLNGVTFAQAEAYIQNNVTDLASAKVVMKKLAKAILILNKQIGL
jgi:hypothetical protein